MSTTIHIQEKPPSFIERCFAQCPSQNTISHLFSQIIPESILAYSGYRVGCDLLSLSYFSNPMLQGSTAVAIATSLSFIATYFFKKADFQETPFLKDTLAVMAGAGVLLVRSQSELSALEVMVGALATSAFFELLIPATCSSSAKAARDTASYAGVAMSFIAIGSYPVAITCLPVAYLALKIYRNVYENPNIVERVLPPTPKPAEKAPNTTVSEASKFDLSSLQREMQRYISNLFENK